MMNDLSNAERETHLNLTADNRDVWVVYSDDPVMMRKLDKIAKVVSDTGTGKHYELDKTQVSLRKKRELAPAQREKLRQRMLELHKHGNIKTLEAQN